MRPTTAVVAVKIHGSHELQIKSRLAPQRGSKLVAAKQRDRINTGIGRQEPQQDVSHSALLLVGPVGTQSCETLFHDVCPLVMELLCTRRGASPACTDYRSVTSRRKSAGC